MTPLENKLRAAFRETADEIPAEAPPLYLSPQPRAGQNGRHPRWHTRWHAWAAPLAAAALVMAAVAGSLTVAGSLKHQPGAAGPPAGPAGVPAYYVALTVPGTYTDIYTGGDGTAAEVRATATGTVLTRITVPRPYVRFAAVTAAADDRTFVLVAEEKSRPLESQYYQPSRFYLLHFDPASGRASLRALPAAFIPAGNEVCGVALSPDGTLLAADFGSDCYQGARLRVFDLATGNARVWNGGAAVNFGFGGTNPDVLSWTADGKHVAFVGSAAFPTPSEVRLLDVTAPGPDLLANSKPVCEWAALGGGGTFFPMWRGVKVTPDGRTVLITEEWASGTAPARAYDQLLKCSAATGQVTTVLNDRNTTGGYWYEQVMYTNATGSVLVVTGVRKGNTAGILRGDAYTSIPWSAHTVTAVW